jgi:tRNA A-37 threonylcarbamoyl transferase component Bud32
MKVSEMAHVNHRPERCLSTAGGCRWQVVPEYQEVLLGRHGLRLAEWLEAGNARIVKHGTHRTVYRVVLPGLDFHLKHFRLHDGRAWLRECIRPSKARLEYERSLAVARRGVPTITPLAIGEAPGVWPGESFLVTRTLPDAESLAHFLEHTLSGLPVGQRERLRHRLAVALGRFVAQMHAAGVVHHDFHAGNLLVRVNEDGEPALFLIDLHTVRCGASLDWPARRANLVILNRWFIMRGSRTDRLRFWEAYDAARLDARHGRAAAVISHERAREVEERTWASNLAFWRQRDRRCLVTNRYYRCVRSPVAAGHAVTDLDLPALDAFLADPDAPFRQPDVVLLKDSRSSTVAELDLPVNGAVQRVIWKRFRVTSCWDPWVSLLRRSPAVRSWVHGHGLRERCLPTPRPLLVLHRRRAGLSYEGYLLTEKVAGAADLAAYLAGLSSLPDDERRLRLRRLIDAVAQLLRELHRSQVSHRDLKAANVLVKEETGGFPSLWLIDLVGVRCHRVLARGRRAQNLARLHASFLHAPVLTRTDRLRFLRVYLEWGLRGKGGWKSWWREVAQATQDKVARNARLGRPLA